LHKVLKISFSIADADVETVNLGRYVLQWRRAASNNLSIVNETVFDLPAIKELPVFLHFGWNCCTATVLWISDSDFYPSRIPDPTTETERGGENNWCLTIFCCQKLNKI
jgi:hypothetical protein